MRLVCGRTHPFSQITRRVTFNKIILQVYHSKIRSGILYSTISVVSCGGFSPNFATNRWVFFFKPTFNRNDEAEDWESWEGRKRGSDRLAEICMPKSFRRANGGFRITSSLALWIRAKNWASQSHNQTIQVMNSEIREEIDFVTYLLCH